MDRRALRNSRRPPRSSVRIAPLHSPGQANRPAAACGHNRPDRADTLFQSFEVSQGSRFQAERRPRVGGTAIRILHALLTVQQMMAHGLARAFGTASVQLIEDLLVLAVRARTSIRGIDKYVEQNFVR